MADENKLATFKWFTDTYTRGAWTLDETWNSDIYNTIFNSISPNSDKVINYNDLISPENYTNTTIANEENFKDDKGNKKCILQSHIKELINTRYTFKIGFQKTTLNSGEDCLYIKMIDIASVNTPPDDKIKIKIIIYDEYNNAKPHNVNIPISTAEKDYTYIIDSNIYRVEIVATSVYRPTNSSNYIVQPQIEYYYTYSLIGLISALDNSEDYDFNGSKITKGERIDNFVINGGSNPDSGGGSGDSTTQKDFVIQDNWINLETVVNNQSNLKICWAAVEYIINNDTILIYNHADIFENKVYALLSNSAEIIERINSIDSDYNNSDKYIFVAFEELYNTEIDKYEINGLENYVFFDDLPDTIHELELTSFIDYGDNLI